ncbi:peptidoglycan-binding domain-containing protein [Micromonospora sp. NPDC051196]|uniref:peptidoglycan-binding domain-containing protein n=1 Tax=Micromonospora sp. NPDC051196 TaxID=3155281 RepID=UPI00342B7402
MRPRPGAAKRRDRLGGRRAVELDDRYGPKTAAAVRRFQSAYGLTADGIAGPHVLGGPRLLNRSR